ncbi:MAG: hypothetical protein M3124_09885 [Actinomycetota bacterium]|nr:hypothetical protein [Actinomycetota bacterium]
MGRRSHAPAAASAEVRVQRIASRHFGVIERAQAIEAGMTGRIIDWRLRTGEWRILFPPVYALRGSTPSWMQTELGAMPWAGPGAAGSGRAAGVLWGFDGIERDASRSPRHGVCDTPIWATRLGRATLLAT